MITFSRNHLHHRFNKSNSQSPQVHIVPIILSQLNGHNQSITFPILNQCCHRKWWNWLPCLHLRLKIHTLDQLSKLKQTDMRSPVNPNNSAVDPNVILGCLLLAVWKYTFSPQWQRKDENMIMEIYLYVIWVQLPSVRLLSQCWWFLSFLRFWQAGVAI